MVAQKNMFYGIFVICCISSSLSYSMLNLYNLSGPWEIKQDDPKNKIRRVSIDDASLEKPFHIKDMSAPTILESNHRPGVCVDWALGQAIPGIERLKIPFGFSYGYAPRIIETYFEGTLHPQKNDIAVYVDGINNWEMLHIGVISTENLKKKSVGLKIKSLWGLTHKMYEHDVFDIPTFYGNGVLFFTLKSKYKKDISLLLEDLESKINDPQQNFVSLKPGEEHNENILRMLAQGLDIATEDANVAQMYQLKQSSLFCVMHLGKAEIMNFLLKINPYLDVNCRNEKGQTPLMLAAACNNHECVRVLILHGADVHAKDLRGKTALDKAYKNESEEASRLLLNNKAFSKNRATDLFKQFDDLFIGGSIIAASCAWGYYLFQCAQ